MKFCTHCGAQLSDEAHFCTACGETQNALPAHAAEPVAGTASPLIQQAAPAKKRLSGCAIAAMLTGVVTLLGMVFLVGLWFLASSLTGDLVKAAEGYLELLKRGQTREAYDMADSGLRKETSLAQFNKVVSEFPILSRHTSFKVNSRQFENDKGYVTGELSDASGNRAEIEFILVKEQGVWRVLTLHVKMLAGLPTGGNEDRLVKGLKPSAICLS